MSVYSLSLIKPSSPLHLPSPDGKTTLCGLPLVMFGFPLSAENARGRRVCKTCARVEETVESWKQAVIA